MATATVTELTVHDEAGNEYYAIQGDADNGGYYWDVYSVEGVWVDSFWAGPFDDALALLKNTLNI